MFPPLQAGSEERCSEVEESERRRKKGPLGGNMTELTTKHGGNMVVEPMKDLKKKRKRGVYAG